MGGREIRKNGAASIIAGRLAPAQGFEPRPLGSEPSVLPLHHSGMSRSKSRRVKELNLRGCGLWRSRFAQPRVSNPAHFLSANPPVRVPRTELRSNCLEPDGFPLPFGPERHSRKVKESNPRAYTRPGFQDQLRTAAHYLPSSVDAAVGRPQRLAEGEGIEPSWACTRPRVSNPAHFLSANPP